MELPREKNKVVEANPQTLILFGRQKSGKTTLLAGLEDCLIIDVEKGSKYVSALSVQVENLRDLKELQMALDKDLAGSDKEYCYTYGAFDTVTALEEMILPLALNYYKKTPMGKDFDGDDVRMLPNGAGYLYIRNAFQNTIKAFSKYFKHIILIGHTTDKTVNISGKELSLNQLDLAGKLGRIVASKADAIGFVFRKDNQCIINFNGGADNVVEARSAHLRGKEIVVSEYDPETQKFTYHWDKIFI